MAQGAKIEVVGEFTIHTPYILPYFRRGSLTLGKSEKLTERAEDFNRRHAGNFGGVDAENTEILPFRGSLDRRFEDLIFQRILGDHRRGIRTLADTRLLAGEFSRFVEQPFRSLSGVAGTIGIRRPH